MRSTLDLLERAKAKLHPMSERALSIHLGHSPTALTTARQRGSLSPEIAGQLADLLELPPAEIAQCMALAYIESKPKSSTTARLRQVLHTIA
jgi:hypothetical protein